MGETMTPKEQTDCICENCFLYHAKKNYCSLDGKQHVGCFKNFMPMEATK